MSLSAEMQDDYWKLEADKSGLISTIQWYRDHYHKTNDKSYHDEMIEKVTKCESYDELELYFKIVDGWIDY